MPPGTAEQRHRHARARQLFFVLSGLLEMELAGTVFEIGAEQALEVPPGAPHQARNPGRDPVRFLVISSPPTSRDRQEVTAPSSPMDDEST
ncbi:cupin domain-containing protein [Roseobacter sp. WL0113]|uniref:Cupin domain-containing protein n=2 Tax=Roseobacter sinensis TaxID=2931391 RepID=A0ABT3BFR3_9RHOB|nr:cupin domain-containing protein [Roseobacter sp. WL0113]